LQQPVSLGGKLIDLGQHSPEQSLGVCRRDTELLQLQNLAALTAICCRRYSISPAYGVDVHLVCRSLSSGAGRNKQRTFARVIGPEPGLAVTRFFGSLVMKGPSDG
jgi:hypothetical protein